MIFPDNRSAGTNEPNLTATKWQHKNLNNSNKKNYWHTQSIMKVNSWWRCFGDTRPGNGSDVFDSSHMGRHAIVSNAHRNSQITSPSC